MCEYIIVVRSQTVVLRIYKSTSGVTVIQNIYLPVQVAQNIMCNPCLVLGSNNTRDQGLALPNACIDIGQSERTAGVYSLMLLSAEQKHLHFV